MKRGFLAVAADSLPVQILVTLAIYSLYAAVLGVSLFAPVSLIVAAAQELVVGPLLDGALPPAGALLLFSLLLAASVFVYFLSGALVMAVVIRILSLGIKPGRYPAISATTARWLIYSGVYTLAHRTILPMIPVSPFINIFFRIIGCRMGRNVRLNTWTLNDAYLISLGDNVVIGGATDISCHLFEANHLILEPISIGSDTLIGAHCYVSPGVSIGKRCTVGLYSFVRRGKSVPDGTRITALAGRPMREMFRIEKNGELGAP